MNPLARCNAHRGITFNASNDSAVQAMGDAKLKVIAAELITQVKKSVTIDWTLRESARGRIRLICRTPP